MWWARRPLPACRAVICASLWPDPADPLCPQGFRDAAAQLITQFAYKATASQRLRDSCSKESFGRWQTLMKIVEPTKTMIEQANAYDTDKPEDLSNLRYALLDFVADFANWNNSTVSEYLETSRALTQAAHESLGGAPGTRPLVIDPFAGGGSIPLEALRVGADTFASDLNPVAVLLNKVILEYAPRYGNTDLKMKNAEGNEVVFKGLAEAVRYWGTWIKQQAQIELDRFYPKDSDGATPIAYLWARTIPCTGPSCSTSIPLLNQLTISKRRGIVAKLTVDGESQIKISVVSTKNGVQGRNGTIRGGVITCPSCGTSTPSLVYRSFARQGKVGERMYAVVLQASDGSRKYRSANSADIDAFKNATLKLNTIIRTSKSPTPLIPNQPLSEDEPRRLNIRQYGFTDWSHLFNSRQKLALVTFKRIIEETHERIRASILDKSAADAISTMLGLAVSNIIHYNTNVSTYLSDGMISAFIQGSAIPMRSDYAEANPQMADLAGGFEFQLRNTILAIQELSKVNMPMGIVAQTSATIQILPEDSVDLLVTDPPYYFAIPYADLSDLFYVWIKQLLGPIHPEILRFDSTPKAEEAIQSLPHSQSPSKKDRAHFESSMQLALQQGNVVVKPSGVAVIVFAHATTDGWESIIRALIGSNWIVSGSWPIDTERAGRMLASRQSTLSSSVHLVCRPRDRSQVGDWRDVLSELPIRIGDWLPRLAQEGVVGADAIFACLGPALEIFSRYSRVERSSGEEVTLREYLEEVWAAVAREALRMIFDQTNADTSGLEEDARLTAMWLWTISTAKGREDIDSRITSAMNPDEADTEEDDDDEATIGKTKSTKLNGFFLDYDAARKIAQGLGAHLEKLQGLVEVKGSTARLMPVAERARFLIHDPKKAPIEAPSPKATKKRAKAEAQTKIFDAVSADGRGEDQSVQAAWGEVEVLMPGQTTLDRVHQSMLLFAAGRSEALKKFLAEDGAGNDQRLWTLAQALSALYPQNSEEKRWVDGVLARKKGFGF
jgi:adenine-specific DNA methylase